MTDNAVAAIRRVIAQADDEDIRGIRIAASSGCEGLRYEMGLEAVARENDAVIHVDGLIVFVDAVSKPLLDGTEVDFCDTPAATGFIFNGPERCSACGKRGTCGS
ncbi:HesB/IscA family protein [Rhizomicrobium electricum]|nr:iron-sulfur cluster assembly accessory protein [Rhizomicrobium electricum]